MSSQSVPAGDDRSLISPPSTPLAYVAVLAATAAYLYTAE
jgi:hypothetical protein